MEVGGALAAWLIPLLCLLGIIGIEWKWKYAHVHVADFFKADPFNQWICVLGLVIILVPLGWLVAIPAGAVGMGIRAIGSEDSRGMWTTRWQARSAIVVAIVIGVIISGFGGVSKPTGAAEWGTPLLTENPEAPGWPASEQHIWNEGGPFWSSIMYDCRGPCQPLVPARWCCGILRVLGPMKTGSNKRWNNLRELD